MKRIDIGPYRYTLYRSPTQLQGYSGLLDTDTRTIVIDGTRSAAGQQETVLHEVLHGIIDLTNLRAGDDGEEEKLVSAIAPWLLLVLRENPKLVEYITGPA